MMIVLVIVVLLVAAFVGMYNSLVQLRNKADNAWSQIDVQLQRRFDLIPNLVEAVKGYMTHEQDTLAKVTELRTSWANASTVNEKAELEKADIVVGNIVQENQSGYKWIQNIYNDFWIKIKVFIG